MWTVHQFVVATDRRVWRKSAQVGRDVWPARIAVPGSGSASKTECGTEIGIVTQRPHRFAPPTTSRTRAGAISWRTPVSRDSFLKLNTLDLAMLTTRPQFTSVSTSNFLIFERRIRKFLKKYKSHSSKLFDRVLTFGCIFRWEKERKMYDLACGVRALIHGSYICGR